MAALRRQLHDERQRQAQLEAQIQALHKARWANSGGGGGGGVGGGGVCGGVLITYYCFRCAYLLITGLYALTAT